MSNNDSTFEKAKSEAKDVSAFIDGQQDCRDGVPHQAGKGESYDMGYRFEYEMGEILGATT